MYQDFGLFHIFDLLGNQFPCISFIKCISAKDFHSFQQVIHIGWLVFLSLEHSNELLDMIDCQNYLIPTNGGGARSYHPDREALANIICHDGRDRSKTVHLYFNYKLADIEARKHFKLFHDDEPEKYNFVIHEPDTETERNGYHVALSI